MREQVDIAAVVRYIQNQKQHHAKMTFAEEFNPAISRNRNSFGR
jgi:hypothetical protein